MATLDELLNALENPNKPELPNTKDTWSRIGNKDSFDELGLEKTELEEFLSEWMEENSYNNI